MAINVQAAPVVNRMIQKQILSYSGFSPCVAFTHGEGKKSIQKKYTCTIYKRIPISDETPIHHTPLLFFLSPPLSLRS